MGTKGSEKGRTGSRAAPLHVKIHPFEHPGQQQTRTAGGFLVPSNILEVVQLLKNRSEGKSQVGEVRRAADSNECPRKLTWLIGRGPV